MKVLPGAAGLDGRMPTAGEAVVVANATDAGPKPLPASAPGMQALMAQLAQRLDVQTETTEGMASQDGDHMFVDLEQAPAGASMDMSLLANLPAMQPQWVQAQQGGRQHAVAAQAVTAAKEMAQPVVLSLHATTAVSAMDHSLRVVPTSPIIAGTAPRVEVSQVAATPAPSNEAVAMPTELPWSGRTTTEPVRFASPDVAASTASETVPVNKGPQALVQALADRVQVQQVKGTQIATVRLDPPQMGSLEIRIRHDAAGVHVQMQASHGEVGRQLATVVDNLRQELLARSPEAHVTVSHSRSMSSGGQSDAQRHAQAWNDEPEVGQALQSMDASALT